MFTATPPRAGSHALRSWSPNADHPVAARARDLTSDEQHARRQTCAALDQRVKASIRKGRDAAWELAEALHQFDEESGWLALGFTYKTEWLAQPEIEMSERTYRRLVGAWRELVVRRRVDRPTLAALDIAKTDVVLPAVRQGRVQLPRRWMTRRP